MARYQSKLIEGPAGKLQVLEEAPETQAVALAVICHPHPLHGGTFTNKVVHQLARTFKELSAVSVRFNFRGVGESEGTYDEGRGELEDLIAVVRWARERWPGLPLWLAGFSFGAVIAIRAAHQLQPGWLVSVAPAVNHIPVSVVAESTFPWLLVLGESDEIVPPQEVLRWLEQVDAKPRIAVLEGAGHFFHGRLNELRQLVKDHLLRT